MAKAKLDEGIVEKLLAKKNSTQDLESSKLSSPSTEFEKLAGQRYGQRRFLFYFTISCSSVSLLILFIAIGASSYFKVVRGNDFSLFNQYELEVLSVAIFGQFIGIVAIIAKSLWDEGPFSDLLKADWKEKHKEKQNTLMPNY